jgi:hypothetical protein
LLFFALREAAQKWTMPIHHWREALNHFMILAGTDAGPGENYAMNAHPTSTDSVSNLPMFGLVATPS